MLAVMDLYNEPVALVLFKMFKDASYKEKVFNVYRPLGNYFLRFVAKFVTNA